MYEDPKRDWMTHHRVVRELRALHPGQPLSLHRALLLAERQAHALLTMAGADQSPISTNIIANLPSISVQTDRLMPRGASGACTWDEAEKTWVIRVQADEPFRRQRFSVCHEFAHVLDYGQPSLLKPGQLIGRLSAREYLAEYFAGCLLMPSLQVKRSWYAGIQTLTELAALFDVSERAIAVRLDQLLLRPLEVNANV